MRVELTEAEVDFATAVGKKKQAHCDSLGIGPSHGFEGDRVSLNVEGNLYEAAFAKAMNLPWAGAEADPLSNEDVCGYQIRGTRHQDGGLLIRPGDFRKHDPMTKWVLVRGENPFEVVGWMYNHEAEQTRWIRSKPPRPKFFLIPAAALRPMETINAEEDYPQAA